MDHPPCDYDNLEEVADLMKMLEQSGWILEQEGKKPVLIADPDFAHYALRHDVRRDSTVESLMNKLAGDGNVLSDRTEVDSNPKEQLRNQIKTEILSLLKPGNVDKIYGPQTIIVIKRYLDEIESGSTINFNELLRQILVESNTRNLMGDKLDASEIQTLSNDIAFILDNLRNVFLLIGRPSRLLNPLNSRYIINFVRALFFQGPKLREQIGTSIERVRSSQFATEKEKHIEEDAATRSILTALAKNLKNNGDSDERAPEYEYTTSRVIAELVISALAAYETTAATSGWILYYLTLPENSGLFEELESEISNFIQNGVLAGTDITNPGSHDLPLLYAIIIEALRLNPPGDINFTAQEDIKTRDQERVVVKNGQSFRVIPEIMHLRTTIKTRTDDEMPLFISPRNFNPKRWLPEYTDSRQLQAMKKAFFGFSGGARACPGEHFAIAFMTKFFFELLKNFAIKPVPGNDTTKISRGLAKALEEDQLYEFGRKSNMETQVPVEA